MTFIDVLYTILYLILALMGGMYVRSNNKYNHLYRDYFMKGLAVKLLGGLSFALVYTFYYTYGGDTKTYFHDASYMVSVFLDSPIDFFKIIWGAPDYLWQNHYYIWTELKYNVGTTEWFTVKIASLAALLGMNSYFSTTIIFSVLSFYGLWKLFLMMVRRYPNAEKAIAFSLLFVPSVFFWGSGIMKDSVVIGFLGLMLFHLDVFIRKGLKGLGSGVVVIVCAYIIYNVKAYVVVSLVPALMLWVVLEQKERIKSKALRAIVFPVFMSISIVAMAFSVEFLGKYTERYSLDTVLGTAHGMQTWHYVEGENESDKHGRGSSYTLGDYEPTLLGTLSMFGPAVNVTLFRPYLWEVKNVAMLAAAIESTIIFLFSLFIFLGLGFFRVIKLLFKDSFLMMAVSFSLFFAFAVGFTSYNFGALVRYKIPCIPFYLCSLFILRSKVLELKEIRRQKYIAYREMKKKAAFASMK